MEDHLNAGAIRIFTVERAISIAMRLRGFRNLYAVRGQMRVPHVNVIDVVDDEADMVESLCCVEFVFQAAM